MSDDWDMIRSGVKAADDKGVEAKATKVEQRIDGLAAPGRAREGGIVPKATKVGQRIDALAAPGGDRAVLLDLHRKRRLLDILNDSMIGSDQRARTVSELINRWIHADGTKGENEDEPRAAQEKLTGRCAEVLLPREELLDCGDSGSGVNEEDFSRTAEGVQGVTNEVDDGDEKQDMKLLAP